MRNNGKKRTTILVAALLALVMTLSLTACQVEIPGVGTINIDGGNTPTGGQVPAAFDIFPVLNVTGGGGADGLPIQQIPYELFMFDPAQG